MSSVEEEIKDVTMEEVPQEVSRMSQVSSVGILHSSRCCALHRNSHITALLFLIHSNSNTFIHLFINCTAGKEEEGTARTKI